MKRARLAFATVWAAIRATYGIWGFAAKAFFNVLFGWFGPKGAVYFQKLNYPEPRAKKLPTKVSDPYEKDGAWYRDVSNAEVPAQRIRVRVSSRALPPSAAPMPSGKNMEEATARIAEKQASAYFEQPFERGGISGIEKKEEA